MDIQIREENEKLMKIIAFAIENDDVDLIESLISLLENRVRLIKSIDNLLDTKLENGHTD